MEDDEAAIFFGSGSILSLREEEDGAPYSYLEELKSVSAAAKAVFTRRPSVIAKSRFIGFHIPKRTK